MKDMTKRTAKISVIIPIYNDELYLTDALNSIQRQTFTDFECICVNDGSTDKSEAIIDKFADSDSRFLKINRKNGGVSAARNTGLEAAQGEYIFMMDHDDLIPEHTLKKLYDSAIRQNADMSRGRMMLVEENFSLEQLLKESKKAKEKYYDNPLTDFYRHMRGKNKNWYYIWQCLYKKSAIEEVRFLEDLRAGGEDYLFTFDVLGRIKNFVQIPDIVACHRKSKISVTQNGYKPQLFIDISKIVIPHIYQKYFMDKNIDKRMLWWVYHKESYAVYRFLIRNLVKRNDVEHMKQTREIFQQINKTPEFKAIYRYWTHRQRMFYSLLMKEKYNFAHKIKIFA